MDLRLSAAADRLPLSVEQLAGKVGLARPTSLRQILTASGSLTRDLSICVLKYEWQKTIPDALKDDVWPTWFYDEIFNAHNGWSVSDYWRRCTVGLMNLHFDFKEMGTLNQDQATRKDDRGGMLSDCIAQAAGRVKVDDFTHTVAFIHPGPLNAGATGSGAGAVFDQNGTLEFYQHEIGHVLGFRHAFGARGYADFSGGFDANFGTNGDYVYEDPWCVMGFTGPQNHPVTPSPFLLSSGRPVMRPVPTHGGFWFEGRRLAAANLYRLLAHPNGSAATAWFNARSTVTHVSFPMAQVDHTVTELLATSEGRWLDPTIVVVEGDDCSLVVEYRIRTGDDRGILPGRAETSAVVVHSIGRRTNLRWEEEPDPIWLEAVIKTDGRSDAWISNVWHDAPAWLHVEPLAARGKEITLQLSRDNKP